MAWLKAGDEVGHWTVRRRLGRGGLAEVYEVVGPGGQVAALKRLMQASVEGRARLRREAHALETLVHENIVRWLGWVEPSADETDAGFCSLIMECIEGPTLLEHARTLDRAGVEQLFLAILDGVAHAHAHGWVHRDLKPSNVLVQMDDDGATPKVADFGIASLAGRNTRLTQSGAFMGTPAYMAPEQVLDPAGADERADVFSLGALLYELVCGRPPFQDEDVLRILERARRGEYPDPGVLTPDLEPRLRAAIRGALCPEPAHRIPSCAVLREVLTGRQRWELPLGGVGASMETVREPRTRRSKTIAVGAGVTSLAAILWAVAWPAGQRPWPPEIADDRRHQERFETAWAAWRDARFERAEPLLGELEGDVGGPWVYTLAGLVHDAQSRPERAMDAYTRAEQEVPSAERALSDLLGVLRLDHYGHDDRLWSALATDHPDHPLVQSLACLRLGTTVDAAAACAAAERWGPQPWMWWRQGTAAMWWPDVDRAEVHARRILEWDPQHPRGLVLMSEIRMRQGAWPEARALAEHAERGQPRLLSAQLAVARTRAHTGDQQGAKVHYDRLLGPDRDLYERMLVAWELAFTELGLGRFHDGAAVLAETRSAAREAENWEVVARLHSVDGMLGWQLADVARLAAAQDGLREATQAPELSPVVAQPLRALVLYFSGLEGILRREPDRVSDAVRRLRASDVSSVAVATKSTALEVLEAEEQALRGDVSRALALARDTPSCERSSRGGELLVLLGHVDEGLERLRQADALCVHHGSDRYSRYRAARAMAATLEACGDQAEAMSVRQLMSEIWPDPDPAHPLLLEPAPTVRCAP